MMSPSALPTSRCAFGYLVIAVYAMCILGLFYDPSAAATTGRKPPQSAINPTQSTKGKTVMYPAFVNAGTKPGLEIWRVENFQPVAYPKNDYGKFYTGDSYIILFTKEQGGKLSWDIHFWLGTETTQDESGAAAIMTVQLDDKLGGVPIQYREVQEHESPLFQSHFKSSGLRYLPGGVASGFRHVDTTVQKKLYQVKGKKNVRVKQVELSVAGMNQGDCFILDAGNDIYVYHGIRSKKVERLKAVSAANLIRDQDHGGRSKIHVIDEFSNQDDAAHFFEVLGSGSPSQIPDQSAGGDDQQFERNEEAVVSLYKVSDLSGSLKVDKLTQKPLKQEMLDTNECFILDTEQADLYVWVGKKCNAKEKSEAMSKAEGFLKSKHYPAWTRVQRIIENGEPSIFRQYFSTWRGTSELHTRLIRDVSFDEPKVKLWQFKIFNNGKYVLAHVTDFEQQDLNEDDVMILQTNYYVFVWFGKDSNEEERRKGMQIAKDLTSSSKTIKNVVSVKQGMEPVRFTDMFTVWEPDFWDSNPSDGDRLNEILNS